jgi:hypothetical protein
VNSLSNKYNLQIYIHTWTTYASKLSWRKIEEDNNIVDENVITSYFTGLTDKIVSIDIDDDSKIQLVGDTEGNVFSTQLPKAAWKRMWYGIYKTALKINNGTSTSKPFVINTRFDLFNNSNSIIDNDLLFNLIDENINTKLTKNVFLYDSTSLIGIDNFYGGTPQTMLMLSENFHNNLDQINKAYSEIFFQEVTVYYEDNRLLGNNNYGPETEPRSGIVSGRFSVESSQRKLSEENENIELYYKSSAINNNKDVETIRAESNKSKQDKISYKTDIKLNINYVDASALHRPNPTIMNKFYLRPLNNKPQPLMTPSHTTTSWGSYGKKN